MKGCIFYNLKKVAHGGCVLMSSVDCVYECIYIYSNF